MTDEEVQRRLAGEIAQYETEAERLTALRRHRAGNDAVGPGPVASELLADALALRHATHAVRVKGMLVEALEAAEWSVPVRGYDDTCPDCGGGKHDGGGHLDACALAKALAEAKREPS